MIIEVSTALLFLRSAAPSGDGNGAVTPVRSDSFREELTESYESREEFALGRRRLTQQGWIIARVKERRNSGRSLTRLFTPVTWHFEVSYERLVPQCLEAALS
jgi:hypothetical protein